MSELTEKLRSEADGLRKAASYQDSYTHAVLRELHDGLGMDKEAANGLSTYDLMEKVKQVLETQSVSPQIGIELNRIRTPDQLVDYLDNADFQLRKTAADKSEDSEDDDEDDEDDKKDKKSNKPSNKKDDDEDEDSEKKAEEAQLQQIKQAAVNELVEQGVEADQALSLVEAAFNDEGDQ